MDALKLKAARWILIALLICATVVGFAIVGCNYTFGAQSPRGSQLFPKLGTKKTTAPALPPLPPGYQAVADTNLYMLGIKRTNANNLYLTWTGPAGTVFQLTSKTNVNGAWSNIGAETTNRSTVIPAPSRFTIYKVRSATSPVVPGQLTWVKTQTTCRGSANDVKVDRAGNVIIVGSFAGTIDFGTGPITWAGGQVGDIFIAKYNAQGTILWAKGFGAGFDDAAQSVSIDSSNNIVVTGYFESTVNFGGTTLASRRGIDVFVAKYRPDGVLLWATNFGGLQQDAGKAVTVDTNNNIFAVSSFSGSATFGTNVLTVSAGTEMALAKISPAGAVLWAKGWGDTGSGCYVVPHALASQGGDVVVTGEFAPPANFGGGNIGVSNPNGLFVAKYSGANGNFQWAKGAGTSGFAQGRGVAIDPLTGNAIISGTIQGTMDFGCGAVTSSATSPFFASYNSSGTCLWNKVLVGSILGGCAGTGIAVDADGVIAVTGQINGTMNMGGGNFLTTSGGAVNLFVATFSPAVGVTPPNYRWGKALSGGGESGGLGVGFNAPNIALSGFFALTKDFGGISAIGVSSGSSFVAEYVK